MAASAVANAVPPQSPFLQLQQQQSQQQQTQQQQWQHQQQQLQHYQRQQQLQFLANALQLQSQLKAHTQAQPGAPAAGVFTRPGVVLANELNLFFDTCWLSASPIHHLVLLLQIVVSHVS